MRAEWSDQFSNGRRGLASRLQEAVAKAQLFDGTLALITNTTDISPAEVVARYKGLADIERGVRVRNSDIEITPVHHRLPDRIRAHALICFLATASCACA